MRRLYLFIPGIKYKAAGVDGWVDRAVSWVHEFTPDRAMCYEYESPATLRFVRQPRRVRDVAAICARHPSQEISLVGHSNGAAIICDVLRLGMRVHELHLIAGAADASFNVNGLNDAVKGGRVRWINLYCSKSDRVLNTWADLSKRVVGWAGLGYGNIGLRGPLHMSDAARAVTKTVWREGYGHSDWLIGKNFDETMGLVTGKEG